MSTQGHGGSLGGHGAHGAHGGSLGALVDSRLQTAAAVRRARAATPRARRAHTGGKRPDTATRNAILTALRECPMTAPELVTVIHGSSPDSALTDRQIARMRNTLATMRQEGTVQSVDGKWRPRMTNGTAAGTTAGTAGVHS